MLFLRFLSPFIIAIAVYAAIMMNREAGIIPVKLREISPAMLFLVCAAYVYLLQVGFFYLIFWVSDKLSKRSDKILILSSLLVPVIYSFLLTPVFFSGAWSYSFSITWWRISFNVLLAAWAAFVWIHTRKIG